MQIVLTLGTGFNNYIAGFRSDPKLPDFSSYVFCEPKKGAQWAVALVAYQSVLALVGLFFALKTRHIYDQLNESREIVMITYNIMFVGIVLFILLNILEPTPIVIYAIEASGCIWISFFTVVVIYFPKVYYVLTGSPYYSDSQIGGAGNGTTANPTPTPNPSRGMSAMSDRSRDPVGATSALSDVEL